MFPQSYLLFLLARSRLSLLPVAYFPVGFGLCRRVRLPAYTDTPTDRPTWCRIGLDRRSTRTNTATATTKISTQVDIIHRYNADEARNLKQYGELPEHARINETAVDLAMEGDGAEDDIGIDFDDI